MKRSIGSSKRPKPIGDVERDVQEDCGLQRTLRSSFAQICWSGSAAGILVVESASLGQGWQSAPLCAVKFRCTRSTAICDAHRFLSHSQERTTTQDVVWHGLCVIRRRDRDYSQRFGQWLMDLGYFGASRVRNRGEVPRYLRVCVVAALASLVVTQ